MRQKRFCIIIAGIMLAAAMLHADLACAQDNGTITVKGKMYVTYFYTGNGTNDYEVTFSPKNNFSVMDGKGYGLYLNLGSLFAGYYLELNTTRFGNMRTETADIFETSDLLMIFSGVAAGPLIQGAGFTWKNFKNKQPFAFTGYQHITQ